MFEHFMPTLSSTLVLIPSDLFTSSTSGLDPHISPAAARAQIARVARARGISVDQVNGLVERFAEHHPSTLTPVSPHCKKKGLLSC